MFLTEIQSGNPDWPFSFCFHVHKFVHVTFLSKNQIFHKAVFHLFTGDSTSRVLCLSRPQKCSNCLSPKMQKINLTFTSRTLGGQNNSEQKRSLSPMCVAWGIWQADWVISAKYSTWLHLLMSITAGKVGRVLKNPWITELTAPSCKFSQQHQHNKSSA